MKIALVHPPLDDPTIPYHSTAYLCGQLQHNGFEEVSNRDLNIEFMNYCLEESVINAFQGEIDARLKRFEPRSQLEFAEQEEFYSLWSAARPEPAAIQRALFTLRDRETFTNYRGYRDSVRQLRRYFQMIGSLCYPSEIHDFKYRGRGRYSIYHLNDLFNAELCSKICYPIERFFFDRCVADPDLNSSDCIGMSIVYDHQLLSALHLMRLFRNRWPGKLLLLGGTATSQAYKYLRDKSLLKRFFELCDGMVVGEGETAICEIAAANGDLSKRDRIPNLITYDAGTDTLHLPKTIHYENVAALPCPVYQYRWEQYWSPERGINYSPTRGCYWNRCTFCDYGLNTDKPTSPWREKPVHLVVEDLKKIAKEQNVKYVYLAVDVMAPGYLERLSDAMRESDLDIRWGAELRLEKIFSKERCIKLAESGCVSVSFGMESGNQRVLDLIDKGTKIQYMGETMKNFAEAGIAVQLMAFSHFPTETEAERKQTEGFVQLHKDSWSAGGIGKFVLTGTALVAKSPEKFGISLITPEKADIVRSLGFQLNAEGHRQMLSAEEGDESFDETGGLFPTILPRPWAGGTDSLHSMIYYSKYGRNFFKENPLEDGPARTDVIVEFADCEIGIQGRLASSDFEIAPIFEGRSQRRKHIAELYHSAIEPTHGLFMEWQRNLASVARGEKKSYWILQNEKRLRVAELVYRLLVRTTESTVTVRELLQEFDASLREQISQHLLWLHKKSYISFISAEISGKAMTAMLS